MPSPLLPPMKFTTSALRSIFNDVYERILRENSASKCGNFAVSFREIQSGEDFSLHGQLRFIQGHWTTEASSALLTVDNFPIRQQNGTAIANLIVGINSLTRDPMIHEDDIHVNHVEEFDGQEDQFENFLEKFQRNFVENWNTQR